MASSLNRSQLSYGRDAADSGLWSYPSRVKGARPKIGRRLSRLYWVNTLGAVAGAIAAGFSPASHSWIAALGRLRSFC